MKETLYVKVRRLESERDEHLSARKELEAGMETLEQGSWDSVRAKFAETVRRMAIVQIKHSKVARELQAATMSESALQVGGHAVIGRMWGWRIQHARNGRFLMLRF